ncbi:MAG: DUF1543 domain-containing protein [Bacteriovorax sp.]
MKLFSVHCGFYDCEISEGIYEFHVNLFVVAESVSKALILVRRNSVFQKKHMHIDGIQEIKGTNGHRIHLIPDEYFNQGFAVVENHLHRDL